MNGVFQKWTLFGWKEVEPEDIKPYQILRILKPDGESVMSGMVSNLPLISQAGEDKHIRVYFYSTPSLLKRWVWVSLIVLLVILGISWALIR